MATVNIDEQRLLLKPREAAKLLSISERQLWEHTTPRGPIPVTRIGNCVRYSLNALQDYIRKQEQRTEGKEVSHVA
ncbi:MAG: helix-turn-helix domain-containing protein [Planctomycetaceae bacterium]|nr:helix-turn-helix domain-containing protein [Planctomycetaceae bacterium]